MTVLLFRGCFTRSSGLYFSWYRNYSNDFPLSEEADLNGRELWSMGILHFNFIKTWMNAPFMIGCVVSVYLLSIYFYVMDFHETVRFMLWSSGLWHRATMWHVGTGVSEERSWTCDPPVTSLTFWRFLDRIPGYLLFSISHVPGVCWDVPFKWATTTLLICLVIPKSHTQHHSFDAYKFVVLAASLNEL